MVDTGSGGLCRLSESVFELDRPHHSEDRMASASVIDAFDPVADGELNTLQHHEPSATSLPTPTAPCANWDRRTLFLIITVASEVSPRAKFDPTRIFGAAQTLAKRFNVGRRSFLRLARAWSASGCHGSSDASPSKTATSSTFSLGSSAPSTDIDNDCTSFQIQKS